MSSGHGRWLGEWCWNCDRRNPIGWSVSDEIWERVTVGLWPPGEEHVLCLACFDQMAEEERVPYHVDDALYPCSWDDWA